VSSNPDFDRWYAATHVRVLVSPSHGLETFGNTLVNYHLISELEDFPGKVRVREGRLEAHPPRVLTPHALAVQAEGFGEEALEYINWLREHEDTMRVLEYGYCLKTDNFSEQVVTASLAEVSERVKSAVRESNDRFAAVLQGVDNPWDVSIVELWRREVNRAAPRNIKELNEGGKLF